MISRLIAVVPNYRLIVRDKNNKEYTINASSTFEIKYNALKFNFNASTKEFLTGGGDQKSTFTVTDVTGGNGKDIQYKFEYTKYADLTTVSPKLDSNNATWTTLKDWSEESTSELIVDKQEDAGYYAVRVSVQNKDNTDSSKISTKTIDKIKVKKPVEVSLTDINNLITKIDTWMSNSLTDTQLNTIKEWENLLTPQHRFWILIIIISVNFKLHMTQPKTLLIMIRVNILKFIKISMMSLLS